MGKSEQGSFHVTKQGMNYGKTAGTEMHRGDSSPFSSSLLGLGFHTCGLVPLLTQMFHGHRVDGKRILALQNPKAKFKFGESPFSIPAALTAPTILDLLEELERVEMQLSIYHCQGSPQGCRAWNIPTDGEFRRFHPPSPGKLSMPNAVTWAHNKRV